MLFPICDQMTMDGEERKAIYDRLRDHGFIIEERETYDEEENDTFTLKYIDIRSLEDLMKLNKVLEHPVAIDGMDIDFLEML